MNEKGRRKEKECEIDDDGNQHPEGSHFIGLLKCRTNRGKGKDKTPQEPNCRNHEENYSSDIHRYGTFIAFEKVGNEPEKDHPEK